MLSRSAFTACSEAKELSAHPHGRVEQICYNCSCLDAERWPSGRRRRSRKPVWAQVHRGFESHSLRHIHTPNLPRITHNYSTVDCFTSLSLSCQSPQNPAKAHTYCGDKRWKMNRLTAAKVGNLNNPGRYCDGEGLYLNIGRRGSKSWVQRISIDGIRRDIGLGEYPTVSLAEAGDLARRNKSAVASGVNPIAEKRAAATPTFRKAALQLHRINLPTWRNRKHAALLLLSDSVLAECSAKMSALWRM